MGLFSKCTFIGIVLCGILPLKPYVVCWDLGDTLVGVTKLGMALDLGLLDCMLYYATSKDEGKLQNKLFDVLEMHGGCQDMHKIHMVSYHTAHRPLPQIMCDWLAGKTPKHKKLVPQIHRTIDDLAACDFFMNELEERLMRNTIYHIFNPETLIKHTYIIKPMFNLARRIAMKGKHQQLIVSNWDKRSYGAFKQSAAGQELSEIFDLDGAIISGYLGVLKPQKEFFDYILMKYQIPASEIIIIDDQLENLIAAEQLGFKVIDSTQGPKKIAAQLKQWGIL